MSLRLEPTVSIKHGNTWEKLTLAQQAALEGAWASALTPALSAGRPSSQFATQLSQQLSAAARKAWEAQQRHERQLRTASLVGGLFSVVGGVVVWLLWRQRHKTEHASATKLSVA